MHGELSYLDYILGEQFGEWPNNDKWILIHNCVNLKIDNVPNLQCFSPASVFCSAIQMCINPNTGVYEGVESTLSCIEYSLADS